MNITFKIPQISVFLTSNITFDLLKDIIDSINDIQTIDRCRHGLELKDEKVYLFLENCWGGIDSICKPYCEEYIDYDASLYSSGGFKFYMYKVIFARVMDPDFKDIFLYDSDKGYKRTIINNGIIEIKYTPRNIVKLWKELEENPGCGEILDQLGKFYISHL